MDIEETLLFPSSESAWSVAKTLEKEFSNLKWDGCNGVNIFSEEYSSDEIDIEDSIAFKTVVALEETEYCRKYETCEKKIICPVSNIPEQEFQPFVRQTGSEEIVEAGKFISTVDESFTMFRRPTKMDVLRVHQIIWRNVWSRKKMFLKLKNDPERFICLGANGLELIQD